MLKQLAVTLFATALIAPAHVIDTTRLASTGRLARRVGEANTRGAGCTSG